MAKKMVCWIVGICMLVLPMAVKGYGEYKKSILPKEVIVYADRQEYTYTELVSVSDVIALVRIEDELSAENSTVIYNEYLQAAVPVGFYGTREATVLKYYKNEVGTGNSVFIAEPACITQDNYYMHGDDYNSMIKGEEYVVFLSTDNSIGHLSIISAKNGRIALSGEEENFSTELTAMVIEQLNLQEVGLYDERK